VEATSGGLSERDFKRLAGLIEQHTGIRMPIGKRTMAEGRLRKRVRALGLADCRAYCELLFEQGGLGDELVNLINVVTTNKTDFFREPDHFDFLARHAVPRLIERERRGNRTLKLWSAASSIGAEAYTLAMVLSEMAPRYRGLRFGVLGTDISTDVLVQATRAIYPSEMVEPVPEAMQSRYLMRSRDPERREVRIVPELRRLVRFRQLNLMDATYPVDRDVDVIFCRNILIYFDKATQKAVLDRLFDHLRPGGYLFLGHSESGAGTFLAAQQVAPTVYARQ
jgi:chemotaxis protein methyltransferase CheR